VRADTARNQCCGLMLPPDKENGRRGVSPHLSSENASSREA
jgi:hypothetical protein